MRLNGNLIFMMASLAALPITLQAADLHSLNVAKIQGAPTPEQRYIVEFRHTPGSNNTEGYDHANTLAHLKGMGVKVERSFNPQHWVAASMSKTLFNKLKQDPAVKMIEPDPVRTPQAQSTPYGISMVQANQLSQPDLSARKVCIIDTGYDLGHADLPDTNDDLNGQANNGAVGNWYEDGHGHGTHVAGTIAALDNNVGVIGVYPGVALYIVKIFNDQGNWTYASDLIDGIQQCQAAGANVISMSLGGSGSSNAENNAFAAVYGSGILSVAAAGNAGNSSYLYPASYPSVVSVAAVTSSGSRASYSQYNDQVEIAAPGSSVYSTYKDNQYATMSGTSMATPHVSGSAALLWSFFPGCSNDQIRNALDQTAQDKGDSGLDPYYGYGIVKVADGYDYLNTYGCEGNTDSGDSGNEDPGTPAPDPISETFANLSAKRGQWLNYGLTLPAGVSSLTINIEGGRGDADLYVRFGSAPDANNFDCRPFLNGNAESCTFTTPAEGDWFIGIQAYRSFSKLTLSYEYQ